jgi:NAD(P)-dependent dehydrogenase (short-subunit alcohol dehydrogenase family)
MRLEGRIAVVTGGAAGIGEALCRRFRQEGAKLVVVADRDAAGAARVAAAVGGLAGPCDVAVAAEIEALVALVEARHGPVALFCSNAGIADIDPDPDNAGSASDEVWSRAWGVNVMAHVHAARALVPRFAARGGGYFLNTVSAAGLLSQIGSAVYSTTKHAAVGFAESLAITQRDQGIRVSILCPQGVDTAMLRGMPPGPQHLDGVLSPDQVAESVVEGLEAERFLILPHPQVVRYRAAKAADYDRWLDAMVRLRARTLTPPADPAG